MSSFAALQGCAPGACYTVAACHSGTFGRECSAVILGNSMSALAGGSGVSNIVLNSTAGQQVIQFTVDMGNMSSISAVNYAAASQATPFACSRFTIASLSKTRKRVRCYTSGGEGTNLAFTVTSCTTGVTRCYTSAGSTQTVSYKAPTITAHSLRLYSTPNNKTNALTLTSTSTVEIAFDGRSCVGACLWLIKADSGTGFYPSSTYTTITYVSRSGGPVFAHVAMLQGPAASPSAYTCTLEPAHSTFTTLACYTASFSTGSGLTFTVTVGGQTGHGTDYISCAPRGKDSCSNTTCFQLPIAVPDRTTRVRLFGC